MGSLSICVRLPLQYSTAWVPAIQYSASLCLQYTAVPLDVGAPLRTVTVRDVIGDLPVIGNGHDQEEMQYSGELSGPRCGGQSPFSTSSALVHSIGLHCKFVQLCSVLLRRGTVLRGP